MEVLRGNRFAAQFPVGKNRGAAVARELIWLYEKVSLWPSTGPSGCGKTTLLLACGAMRKPTDGVVRLAGEDVYALSASRRAALRSTKNWISFSDDGVNTVPDGLGQLVAGSWCRRG